MKPRHELIVCGLCDEDVGNFVSSNCTCYIFTKEMSQAFSERRNKIDLKNDPWREKFIKLSPLNFYKRMNFKIDYPTDFS